MKVKYISLGWCLSAMPCPRTLRALGVAMLVSGVWLVFDGAGQDPARRTIAGGVLVGGACLCLASRFWAHRRDAPPPAPLQRPMLAGRVVGVPPRSECSVCLDPVRAPAFETVCGHWFCDACLRPWLERSTDCPVCRTLLVVAPCAAVVASV